MELEIKVMWCKGLTAFNFFQKLSIYAAVWISSEDERIQLTEEQKQEQKTPVDEDGEGNPEWNHTVKFDLQPLHFIDPDFKNLSLVFELRNPGQLFGDKIIGEVRVRLSDLIQSVGNEFVRFVKYEVRNPEGKHNGILDFSYKVIGHVNANANANHDDVQITGYHHHENEFDASHEHQHQHQQLNDSYAQSTNSEIHMIGYHHHHHHHNHSSHLDESVSHSESEKIEYPKIDLEGFNQMVSAPPLVYPPPSSSSSLSSSLVYPPPAQTWAPPLYPPPPSHYPPPPPPQPNVYPPPPPDQQPYGEPHWGYHRPHGYHPHW